ncbi:MAG: hypothetical protein ABI167_06250 [Nitrosospira sp.]
MRELAPVFCATHLDSAQKELVRIKPQVLLLDYSLPQLDGAHGISGLMKLNPATSVIILSPPLSDDIEWSLFRIGIRGCCRADTEPGLLTTVVEAVQQGELWIRRALSRHLLDEL